MAFKRSDIPGEDIRLAMGMTQKRRELIAQASSELPSYDFGVNRLAEALHPGTIRATIEQKQAVGVDCCRIRLKSLREDGSFPYFRAGQFVTLSSPVGDSFLSRPYSIASSPQEALDGKLEIIVQKKGLFSTYLIEEASLGATLTVGEPSGDFYHDDVRDKQHVVAIAGGSGITPFLSMMRAIREGSEDFCLTLLYGVRTMEHLVFDPKDFADDRIEIVVVLSDEEREGYAHGFIDEPLLKKHIKENSSVFLCGPDAMYRFVRQELTKLGWDLNEVRQERNSVGDRTVAEEKTFELVVRIRDERYVLPAKNSETLVTAMERAGIQAPVRCRNGVCGFCHSRVVKGDYCVEPHDDFRRAADRKFGYIHPCTTYPESDMEIEVPIFQA